MPGPQKNTNGSATETGDIGRDLVEEAARFAEILWGMVTPRQFKALEGLGYLGSGGYAGKPAEIHPSLQPRGGVDPSSDTYFSDLGETKGD